MMLKKTASTALVLTAWHFDKLAWLTIIPQKSTTLTAYSIFVATNI